MITYSKKFFLITVLFLVSTIFTSCSREKEKLGLTNTEYMPNRFVLDTVIQLPLFEKRIQEALYCRYKHYLWKYDAKDTTIILKRIDLETFKQDSIIICTLSTNEEAGLLAIASKWGPVSFSINDNICVVQYQTGAIYWHLGKNYIPTGHAQYIPLEHGYNTSKIIGNHIVFNRLYNNATQNRFPVEIALWNVNTNEWEKNKYRPKFDLIELSHFNQAQWIDCSENEILFSQATTFSINIMDVNFDVKSTIRNPDWYGLDASKYHSHSENENVKKVIDNLAKYIDTSSGSTINRVSFLTDSLILIRYTGSDSLSKKREINYYELWGRHNNIWSRSGKIYNTSYYPSEWLKNESLCSRKTMPFICYPFSPIFYYNKKCYTLIIGPPPSLLFDTTKTYRQLYLDQEKYFADHDPVMSLTVYNIFDK